MKYKLSKKEQKNLIRILVSLGAFIVLFAVDKSINLAGTIGGKLGWLLPFFLYLAVYLSIGYDILWTAIRNIGHGQFLDENFLMSIASLGAFALAITRGVSGLEIEGFDEACAVLLFYQVGEFFQRYATSKSRKSISSLMDIRPDYANVLRDGEAVTVDPSEVKVGDIILVNPGEKIPLDGVCVKGESALDTKALTGESLPREIGVDSPVISGSVNLTSQIEVRVEKEFYDSTVSKILDLVENASDKKSKAENFITKFARFYTPTVVVLAILLAVIPGAVTGEWTTWTYRALSFLVVSCPCALVISIPLSFFAGIGAASKYHILIKGSNYLERMSKANVFVFDKTGTLTKGNFAVTNVVPAERKEEILRLASIAEQGSSHPIALSIISEYDKLTTSIKSDINGNAPDSEAAASAIDSTTDNGYTLTNLSGRGVSATNGESVILCGNEKLMQEYDIKFTKSDSIGTTVYVAKDGEFIGCISIADELKEETSSVINQLNTMGKTVMLTGDNAEVASAVASQVGVS
ncbi:MAG: heavy metal translocating P-type ATPase [Clostridia bacterium]|nr:heavy metal translocating P-type ATPase [Clostridia bacterium]